MNANWVSALQFNWISPLRWHCSKSELAISFRSSSSAIAPQFTNSKKNRARNKDRDCVIFALHCAQCVPFVFVSVSISIWFLFARNEPKRRKKKNKLQNASFDWTSVVSVILLYLQNSLPRNYLPLKYLKKKTTKTVCCLSNMLISAY